MTVAEQDQLQRLASVRFSNVEFLKENWLSFLWMAAVLSLVATLIWQLAAWVTRTFLDFEIGWNHPNSEWIFAIIINVCTVYVLSVMLRAFRPPVELRDKIASDISNGSVSLETYSLTDVITLQEPEHGGLIHFLRTSDDRVYVTYDQESQELSVAGKDPLGSSFTPRVKLTREVAPHSKIVLSESFSGERLARATPAELTVDPDQWPESGEFASTPWSDIEKKFCG